jgi:hypothetical protein
MCHQRGEDDTEDGAFELCEEELVLLLLPPARFIMDLGRS